MNHFSLIDKSKSSIPLIPVLQKQFATWLREQSKAAQQWLKAQQFKAEPATFCIIPDSKGQISQVIVGISNEPDLYALAHLPMALPIGDYQVEDRDDVLLNIPVEQGWGLAAYQFTRYKKAKRQPARLVLRKHIDKKFIENLLKATYLVRDLVNTPADDMCPADLAVAAKDLAKQFDAKIKLIVGKDLLKENYPTIYTVGRACTKEPHLIDLRWGKAKHKKITLVGKGVCFDTGGLDIKPADGMLGMKKDMGGAAHVLALAYLIMSANLPVCLRVLIPAVENSIAGNAYHPSDVITTRKGLTVEVGNTDAEGRLILCDALAEAVTEKPDLLLNFATLTGAARVALGAEVAVFFSNNEQLAAGMLAGSEATNDPVWRLPLYKNYRSLLNSDIADLNNVSSVPYGGAITAALFLKEFVPDDIAWAHFDIMAANIKDQPGRPKGGEAQGLRASFEYICSIL